MLCALVYFLFACVNAWAINGIVREMSIGVFSKTFLIIFLVFICVVFVTVSTILLSGKLYFKPIYVYEEEEE